jgi:hypothetical protein
MNHFMNPCTWTYTLQFRWYNLDLDGIEAVTAHYCQKLFLLALQIDPSPKGGKRNQKYFF